jgi:predicted RNA-binding protein YlxR (DUF448 family)
MLRLVVHGDRSVGIDERGSAPGRGAYVCDEPRCIERLKDRRRLARAFRGKC